MGKGLFVWWGERPSPNNWSPGYFYDALNRTTLQVDTVDFADWFLVLKTYVTFVTNIKL